MKCPFRLPMRLLFAAGFGSLFIAIQPVQAQSGDGYNYTINPSDAKTITITEYTGPGGAVIIPTNINGLTEDHGMVLTGPPLTFQ